MKNKITLLNIFSILLILVLLVVHFYVTFNFPLGEDESFYGYRADNVLEGNPLHSGNLFSNHGSLTVYFLSLMFFLFGSSIITIKLTTLLVNIVFLITIFIFSKRYFKLENRILICCLTFVYLFVFSFTYTAEYIATIFGIWGIYFYFKFLENQKIYNLFIIGLFFTLSIWFKQTGVLFFVAIVIHQFYTKKIKADLMSLFLVGLTMIFFSMPLLIYFYITSGFNFIWDLITFNLLAGTRNPKIFVLGKLFRMLLYFFGFLFVIILSNLKENKEKYLSFFWIFSILMIIFYGFSREIFGEHLMQLAPFLIILGFLYYKNCNIKIKKVLTILIIVSMLTLFMVDLERTVRDVREDQKSKQQEVVDFLINEIPQGSIIYSTTDKYTYLTGFKNPYPYTTLAPFVESVGGCDYFSDFIREYETINYAVLTTHQKKYLGEDNLNYFYSQFELIKEFRGVAESNVEVYERWK